MYVDRGELLEHAAKPTLAVFGWLKPKMPSSLRRLPDTLGRHFLDPGYSLGQLKEALRLSSNRFIGAFRDAVDVTPWNLIRECRLETAARLLRDTSLPVGEITLLVGYDSEQTFSRLFEAWCGMRPTVYRLHVRAVMMGLEVPLEELFSWSQLDQLRRGELSAEKGEAMLAALARMRPPRD